MKKKNKIWFSQCLKVQSAGPVVISKVFIISILLAWLGWFSLLRETHDAFPQILSHFSPIPYQHYPIHHPKNIEVMLLGGKCSNIENIISAFHETGILLFVCAERGMKTKPKMDLHMKKSSHYWSCPRVSEFFAMLDHQVVPRLRLMKEIKKANNKFTVWYWMYI